MASTNSVQAPYDAERDYIDSMVTRLADPDYIEPQVLMQIFTEGNHQPAPPIQDDSEDEYWKYIALHKAAVEGDWEKAKKFFEKNQEAVTANINSELENALHVAIQAGGNKAINFVNNLVEKMPIEDLEHKNISGRTVLLYAVVAGNTPAAVILVEKHPRLLYICDENDNLPVQVAAEYDYKDTFQYLLSMTEEENDGVRPFAGESGVHLVRQVIFSGYYDEALKLIERYPELAKLQLPNGDSVLSAIALMESAFKSGSHINSLENAIYSCVPVNLDRYDMQGRGSDIENPVPHISVSQRFQAMLYKVLAFLVPDIKHIREKKQVHHQAAQLVKLLCQQIATRNNYKAYKSIVRRPLLSAAELGVKEVVEEILDSFPEAVWFFDEGSHSVFQLAILHRQEKVFNIIYKMDPYKQILSRCLDKEKNNMLHLAGRLAPPSKLDRIPGAALQMQRELQWFKEVEKFVPSKYRLLKNKEGESPAMLFTREHKDLVREGEIWMKHVANSCAIVASLIATITFAAAITVPGGNDDSGLPIFSKESAFIIFAISNAFSLFTSASSLLMFLSILTSRYEEKNFLYVLPCRLIIILVTLFLSIISMMVAFTTILYLVAGNYKKMILIVAVVGVNVPIYIFQSLQFPPLLELIYSTYGTFLLEK